MTRLLVSVRDAEEAQQAWEGGAAIIDVKEPAGGPLGASTPETLRRIEAAVGGRVPLSAAAGELLAAPNDEWFAALTGYSWIKVGLAGCAHEPDWRGRWRALAGRLPGSISLVAVAYADHYLAQSPALLDVAVFAERHGSPWLLIDTWEKSAGRLFDYVSSAALKQLVASAHRHSLRVALAGSLVHTDFPAAEQAGADIIAVRGAACGGGRLGRVQAHYVKELFRSLSTPRPCTAELLS